MRDGAARLFTPILHDGGESATESDNRVRAPMPGLVKAVHVTTGEEVEAGARLVTLEAMKMEHSLRAPRSGIIATIAVAAGDQVAEGALLAALAGDD